MTTGQTGEIFVIGDSHIGLKDGDEKRMVTWVDRLEALKPKSLYLNGDLFHYYIGNPNFITSSVEKVFDRFRALRETGVGVHYVEGNRDFFVKGSFAETSVTDTRTEYVFEAGPKKYFVVHGDMINDRDWPYRFWRRVSKNPVTRLGVRLIPKKTARNFVDGVEKKLARSNFKHKTHLPIDLMKAYGRARGNDGMDVVVFGHFHKKLEIDAGETRVAVVPAWFEKGEAMVVSPTTGEYRFEVV